MNPSIDLKDQNAQNLKSIVGPSFLDDLPNPDSWQSFLDNVQNQDALGFANLWHSKASEAQGVPLRKDFSFEELVKYGANLFMAKLTDDNHWATTYCGNEIADKTGFDATDKLLDDFGASKTLDFWISNLKILVGEHRPILEYHTLEFADKEYIHCTALNFPLRSKDGEAPNLYISHELFTAHSLLPDQLK